MGTLASSALLSAIPNVINRQQRPCARDVTGAWQVRPLAAPLCSSRGKSLCTDNPSLAVCPQVLFKMVLGSAKFGEAALFLSIVGSANFVFISFVPVILYFTRVEYIGSPADIPWAYLCGVAGLLFGTEG